MSGFAAPRHPSGSLLKTIMSLWVGIKIGEIQNMVGFLVASFVSHSTKSQEKAVLFVMRASMWQAE